MTLRERRTAAAGIAAIALIIGALLPRNLGLYVGFGFLVYAVFLARRL